MQTDTSSQEFVVVITVCAVAMFFFRSLSSLFLSLVASPWRFAYVCLHVPFVERGTQRVQHAFTACFSSRFYGFRVLRISNAVIFFVFTFEFWPSFIVCLVVLPATSNAFEEHLNV